MQCLLANKIDCAIRKKIRVASDESGASDAKLAIGASDQTRKRVPAAEDASSRCCETVAATSANVLREPMDPAPADGPNARMGTFPRVWSVPRQVGSQPWSAVIT